MRPIGALDSAFSAQSFRNPVQSSYTRRRKKGEGRREKEEGGRRKEEGGRRKKEGRRRAEGL